MKYIFFVTPEFALTILEKLIKNNFIPQAIVCNPDKPVGRKKILTPPPVKSFLQKLNNPEIKIFQPIDPKEIYQDLLNLNPDLFIVAAYGKIIPQKLLTIPKLGSIGVHPSLLPKYRGASPIQRAILNGDQETGVSLFLMDEQLDHGPVIVQKKLTIDKLNFEILSQKLAQLGGELLVETLPKFIKGEYTLQPQNDKEATYAPKITIDDAYVDLEIDDPIIIERKVRALNPEPGVWTYKDNKRMKILEVELTQDNQIKLKKIQFEGKKPQIL